MANELATTPPGAPPQAGEPIPRSTWVTDPWQAQPPRAPVDPPPCADPVSAAAGLVEPLARTEEKPPEGLPPEIAMTPEKWMMVMPHATLGGAVTPRAAPTLTTSEPVLLGKATASDSQINTLVERAKHSPQERS